MGWVYRTYVHALLSHRIRGSDSPIELTFLPHLSLPVFLSFASHVVISRNSNGIRLSQSYRVAAPLNLQPTRRSVTKLRSKIGIQFSWQPTDARPQGNLDTFESKGKNVPSNNIVLPNKAKLAAALISAAAIMFVPTVSHAFPGSSLVQSFASTNSLLSRLTETGFYQAFSLVFLSEIGDKTFFIAGLLAMKTSKFVSYVGAMGALIVMTLISVVIGQIFHAVPVGIAQGIPLDDVAAVAAFTFFGIKTLKEAFEINSEGGSMDEELAEAEEVVEGSSTIKQVTAW